MDLLSFTNKKEFKKNGFTLIEMAIVLALMGGVGLIAAKIFEIVDRNSKVTTRKEHQLNYHVTGIGVLQSHLKGLKRHQFDMKLFYQIDPASKLLVPNVPTPPNELQNYPGTPHQLTSFIFKKKMGSDYLNYITVCLPLKNILDTKEITYQSLLVNNLWPFVRSEKTGYAVHCCPRNEPMCTNRPLFNKNTELAVQMFRHDSKTNSLVPILKSGELSAVSSIGYFIFSDKKNEKALHGRFFTFFNECVSQRILFGKNSENCSDHIAQKTTEFVEEFDYEIEGINNLGGSIGL